MLKTWTPSTGAVLEASMSHSTLQTSLEGRLAISSWVGGNLQTIIRTSDGTAICTVPYQWLRDLAEGWSAQIVLAPEVPRGDVHWARSREKRDLVVRMNPATLSGTVNEYGAGNA